VKLYRKTPHGDTSKTKVKIVKAIAKQVTLVISDDWWGWRRDDAEHIAYTVAPHTCAIYHTKTNVTACGRTAGNVAVCAAAADDVARGRITCDLRSRLCSARLTTPPDTTADNASSLYLPPGAAEPSGSPNGLTSVISRDAYVRSDKCRRLVNSARRSASRRHRQLRDCRICILILFISVSQLPPPASTVHTSRPISRVPAERDLWFWAPDLSGWLIYEGQEVYILVMDISLKPTLPLLLRRWCGKILLN